MGPRLFALRSVVPPRVDAKREENAGDDDNALKQYASPGNLVRSRDGSRLLAMGVLTDSEFCWRRPSGSKSVCF
jgi:hypothetical protein